MTMSSRSRRVLTGLAIAGFISASAGAYAYWSSLGSGSGSAQTGTALPLTLSAADTSDDLRPGGVSAVSFVASNPNPSSVKVGSFAIDVARGENGFAVDAGHAACSLSALVFSPPSNASGWTVPAASGGTDGSLAVSLAGALSMDATADSACQGATFTVYLEVAS